jgi:MATE family multidrug resistance protein
LIQIINLSYPIIIGQLGIVLMGVVDILMIGKLGATQLAAASLANAIYFLISIVGVGTLTAISTIVAKAQGAKQHEDCGVIFRQGIISAILLSVFISSIVYIVTDNISMFKQGSEVEKLTVIFLNAINIGTLPLMLFLAVKQFSDGLSYTFPSAVITIIAIVLNAFLNWALIFGNFGFPKLELFGSGLATTISRTFMAICMFSFVLIDKRYKQYIAVRRSNKAIIFFKEIFTVGVPSGMQYFSEEGAFAFAGIMIGWISDKALASHQIVINIASVTYMIAIGIASGGSIAVGNAVGRKNQNDIIKSSRAAFVIVLFFMALGALIFAFCNKFLVSLYVSDYEVENMAANLLIIAAFFQMSDGLQSVALGVLRGLEDTKVPTIITFVAYWIIGIPLGYYLCFKTSLGLYGIWIALSIVLTFSASILLRRFMKESREISFE